jgi:hypothetical protein
MHSRDPEAGATLILLIGVIAALSILSAALVTLSTNVMHNTGAQTMEVKAFNVAEAGIDSGQQTLWATWPGPGSTTPVVDPTAFAGQFPASKFPAPTSGQFINVAFYDDDGAPLPNPGIDRAVHVDQNDNGIMWIESRGATGSGSAQVMACVQKVEYDLRIRNGVAIFSGGDLEIKGTGNQPVVGLDPPATAAQVLAVGDIDFNGQSDTETGIGLEQYTSTTLQDVFPSEILLSIIQAGKSFANWSAYTSWKSSHPGVEPFATDPRIIIIENGDVDAKNLPDTDEDPVTGRDTVWSEEDPGILVVLNGGFNQTGQHKTIYGIVYVANGFVLGGNAEVHGMVVAEGWGNLHGTRAVDYNQNVIDNLQRPMTLSVKLVPNTWRELQPAAAL